MGTSLRRILLIALGTVIFLGGALGALWHFEQKMLAVWGQADVRQMVKLIQIFEKEQHRYPKSLEELVDAKFLRDVELGDHASRVQMHYFQPPSKVADPEFVVILGKSRAQGYVILGHLSGRSELLSRN